MNKPEHMIVTPKIYSGDRQLDLACPECHTDRIIEHAEPEGRGADFYRVYYCETCGFSTNY